MDGKSADAGTKEKKGSAKQKKATLKEKWYVNIDENMNSFSVGTNNFTTVSQTMGPYGPDMPIEVTLHSNNTSKTFEAKWSLESDTNNTDPAFQGTAAAKIRLAETTEENPVNERRFFKNWLELPDIGGDRHTVKCTKVNKWKKDRDILELEVETWRRVWFTIFWTDDSQVALINDVVDTVRAAFAKAKIDMVHVPAETKLDCTQDFGAIVDSYNQGEDFIKTIHGGQEPKLKRMPFHLQIVMVKNCAKLKEIDIKAKINAMAFDKLEMNQDGSKITGIKFEIPEQQCMLTNSMIAQIERVRGIDFMFEQTIKSLKIKIGDAAETVVNPPYVAVREKPNGLSNTFILNLNGPFEYISDALLNDGKPVDFDFKLEVSDLSLGGQSLGNRIVIQSHEITSRDNLPGPKSTDEIAKILIHEIGHSVGLVPDPQHDFRWQHPNHYTGHGGIGNHCSLNAVLNEGIYKYSNAGKMCIMFHQIHDQAGPEFCEDCMKYLKFTKLRKATLGGRKGLGGLGWTLSS